MTVRDVLVLMDLAMHIGIPAVKEMVKVWGEDHEEITPADISLLYEVKHPEDYLAVPRESVTVAGEAPLMGRG